MFNLTIFFSNQSFEFSYSIWWIESHLEKKRLEKKEKKKNLLDFYQHLLNIFLFLKKKHKFYFNEELYYFFFFFISYGVCLFESSFTQTSTCLFLAADITPVDVPKSIPNTTIFVYFFVYWKSWCSWQIKIDRKSQFTFPVDQLESPSKLEEKFFWIKKNKFFFVVICRFFKKKHFELNFRTNQKIGSFL